MTCIIGLIHDGKVFMGGDSAASAGWTVYTLSSRKVFHTPGGFLMGYTGTIRTAQVLRYAFVPPEHPEGMDTDTYLATLFIDALREATRLAGNELKRDEQESITGAFLVGYRGRLFHICSDFGFTELVEGFNCIGSGGEVALGAMYATTGMPLEPQKRMMLALEAAASFCLGVRGPFYVETLHEDASCLPDAKEQK